MQPTDDLSLRREDYQTGWESAYEQKQRDFLWDEKPIDFLARYVDFFIEKGVKTVLEAGCGDGRNALYLLEKGLFVVGLDISSIALAHALELAHEKGQVTCCFFRSDLEKLPNPFPEKSFDAITCLDVFGQFQEIESVITGFKKVVKANGLILLNLYTPEDAAFGVGKQIGERSFLYKETLFRFFTEEDIRTLFKDFTILQLEKLHWQDPPHPGFRDDFHTHDSFIVLLQGPT